MGRFGTHNGSKNGSKTHFSRTDPRPFGTLKQVILAHFQPMLTRFGPCKMRKCLANGPFWEQKWVKNGGKTHFSKSDHAPFGMLKQVLLAHFEHVVMLVGPWKVPECLANGPFWGRKYVKNGSKCIFPKVIQHHLGCSSKCFYPIFEVAATTFSPMENPKNAAIMGRFGTTNNGSKMGQKCIFPKVIMHQLGCTNKCF